jgi:cytochrome c-type biogenesis protein CcsB
MIASLLQVVKLNLTFSGLLFVTSTDWSNLILPKFRHLHFISYFSASCVNIVLFYTLGSRWFFSGYFPLSNLYESLLFLTWIILSIQLFTELRTRSKIVGSVLTPICSLITAFTFLVLPVEMQKVAPLVPALQSNWLMMHVSMMMVSYATLILGSLFCVLFLIITGSAKTKRISSQTVKNRKFESIQLNRYKSKVISHFTFTHTKISFNVARMIYFLPFLRRNYLTPSAYFSIEYFFYQWCSNLLLYVSRLKLLNNIDVWGYRTIGLGFPFLTIGIISGAVWANESWGSYWSWDPKETWALITWLVFASYLHARITKNWEGTKTAIIGTLGFFVIWICYLGVNFLGRGLHSYGWLS